MAAGSVSFRAMVAANESTDSLVLNIHQTMTFYSNVAFTKCCLLLPLGN